MIARSAAAILLLASTARPALSFAARPPTFLRTAATSTSTSISMSSSKPISIIVEADIKPDRMEEFLDLIQKNAEGSRKEPGCQRFDVLRSQDDENKFFFYEVYDDAEAVAHHKAQPHFDLWTQFKASEGIVGSVSKKALGEFMT